MKANVLIKIDKLIEEAQEFLQESEKTKELEKVKEEPIEEKK